MKKALFSVGCLVCLGSSCPGTSNSAAVLEGDWQMVFDEPGDLEGYDVQATFDANGILTEITATPPTGGTATLTVANTTTSTVDGSAVTITIPRGLGGTSVFEGTLSDDQNSIPGSLSQTLQLPSGSAVTLPGGDLTLNRIQ